MKLYVFILGLISLLTACVSPYASNGEAQYVKSRNGPNLIIPPPLSNGSISHFYDLPSQERNVRMDIVPPTD